jgi:peroxiredoxin
MANKTRVFDFALIAACLGSAALLVLYTARVKLLEARDAPRPTLTVGQTAPTITGVDITGKTKVVRFEGELQPTIVYVFTPVCGWCRVNMANFQTLMRAGAGSYRFVGVSLLDSGVPEYVKRNTLHFATVFRSVPKAVADAYHWGATPETIVISRSGRVTLDMRGAYVGANANTIEARFHIKLPGLLDGVE